MCWRMDLTPKPRLSPTRSCPTHTYYRNNALLFSLQTTLLPPQGLRIPAVTKDHVGPYLVFLSAVSCLPPPMPTYSPKIKTKPLINFRCFAPFPPGRELKSKHRNAARLDENAICRGPCRPSAP